MFNNFLFLINLAESIESSATTTLTDSILACNWSLSLGAATNKEAINFSKNNNFLWATTFAPGTWIEVSSRAKSGKNALCTALTRYLYACQSSNPMKIQSRRKMRQAKFFISNKMQKMWFQNINWTWIRLHTTQAQGSSSTTCWNRLLTRRTTISSHGSGCPCRRGVALDALCVAAVRGGREGCSTNQLDCRLKVLSANTGTIEDFAYQPYECPKGHEFGYGQDLPQQ